MIRYFCHDHDNKTCRHHHHRHHIHPPQMSLDRLELSVDGGRVKIFVQIGHYDKTLIIGQVIMVMIRMMMVMVMIIIDHFDKTLIIGQVVNHGDDDDHDDHDDAHAWL